MIIIIMINHEFSYIEKTKYFLSLFLLCEKIINLEKCL